MSGPLKLGLQWVPQAEETCYASHSLLYKTDDHIWYKRNETSAAVLDCWFFRRGMWTLLKVQCTTFASLHRHLVTAVDAISHIDTARWKGRLVRGELHSWFGLPDITSASRRCSVWSLTKHIRGISKPKLVSLNSKWYYCPILTVIAKDEKQKYSFQSLVQGIFTWNLKPWWQGSRVMDSLYHITSVNS